MEQCLYQVEVDLVGARIALPYPTLEQCLYQVEVYLVGARIALPYPTLEQCLYQVEVDLVGARIALPYPSFGAMSIYQVEDSLTTLAGGMGVDEKEEHECERKRDCRIVGQKDSN